MAPIGVAHPHMNTEGAGVRRQLYLASITEQGELRVEPYFRLPHVGSYGRMARGESLVVNQRLRLFQDGRSLSLNRPNPRMRL